MLRMYDQSGLAASNLPALLQDSSCTIAAQALADAEALVAEYEVRIYIFEPEYRMHALLKPREAC